MAVNELGNSPYSEMINYATQGSPPSQPQPPKLGEVTDSSIHLLWSKRPCDDEFTLQMEVRSFSIFTKNKENIHEIFQRSYYIHDLKS